MPHDLLSTVNWLDLDTSVQQARSRVDGRVYPVEPLSAEQVEDLAGCLRISVDPRVAWALNDAIKGAVRNLAAFFEEPSEDIAVYEAERLAALKKIAADPARAISEPGETSGARAVVDLLLALAEGHGIDPETRAGAVAIGDLAADMASQKKPRADQHFSIGEAGLFDDIIAIAAVLHPEAMTLPSNEPTPRKEDAGENRPYPLVDFAEEFLGQVVDRTLASYPTDDVVRVRLHRLKARSRQSVVKALREPRSWWRDSAADAPPGSDLWRGTRLSALSPKKSRPYCSRNDAATLSVSKYGETTWPPATSTPSS